MGLDYYYVEPSPPSRAGLMVAREIGVELNHHIVSPIKGETRTPDFLKKNPAHTVPVLVDGDLVIADSHAILTYLVDTYAAGHQLYPADRKVRAKIDRFLFLNCGSIFPDLLNLFFKIFAKNQKPTDGDYNEWKENRLSVIEAYLDGNDYLVGKNKTIADLALYASVSFAKIVLSIELSDYPKVAAWFERTRSELPYDEEVNVAPSMQLHAMLQEKLKTLA